MCWGHGGKEQTHTTCGTRQKQMSVTVNSEPSRVHRYSIVHHQSVCGHRPAGGAAAYNHHGGLDDGVGPRVRLLGYSGAHLGWGVACGGTHRGVRDGTVSCFTTARLRYNKTLLA